MAVLFEGFSIREYASKMRSVNVAKCWPFDDDDNNKERNNKREEIERLLPPMTCRKYRWWKNEVQNLKPTTEEEERKDENSLEEQDEGGKPLSEIESGFEIGNFAIEKQKAVLRREKVDLVVDKEKEKEEERLGMVCPVCQIFTAATVNAVNVHIDSCLAKASKKERKQKRKEAAAKAVEAKAKSTKSRKKKRSIVEIFAVAPPIENLAVEGDEEEENDVDEQQQEEEEEKEVIRDRGERFGDSVKSKKLKGKKKSRLKIDMIRKNLKLKNTEKNKKKKIIDRSLIKMNAKKKGINDKHKVPLPAAFSLPSKGLLSKTTLLREISDKLVIRKIKPTSKKSLSMQNKLNHIQASKLIPKHQQGKLPIFPVHSILKNQRRAVSIQKSSSVGNLQGCKHTNLLRVQGSERHVRFSGKDDILGPTNNWFSSFELPQMQSHQEVLSQVMDDALVTHLPVDHDEIPYTDEAPEVNGGNEDVITISCGDGVRSTNGKKWLDDLNGHVSQTKFPSPRNSSFRDKGKGFSDEYLDQTLALQHHDDFPFFSRGNSAASYNLPSAGTLSFLNSTLKEGFCYNVETQAGGDVREAADTSGSVPNPSIDAGPRFSVTTSLPTLNIISQPSAVCLTTNTEANGRQHFFSQSTRHTSNDSAVDYQPLSHLSPKDLMSCTPSSVEWKKQTGSFCGRKYIDEDFIGLPLNSLGELIQFNSSGKVGYNHLKKQDIMVSSSSFPTHTLLWANKEKQYVERAPPRENLKLFPEKNCFREDPKVPGPSRLGITEMQSTGRTEVHWQGSLSGTTDSIHQLGSELKLVSCYGCKQCRSTPNQSENEKIQSQDRLECGFLPPNQTTMRLMGKDVTVGRTNKDPHCFEDGSIWMDKEIIAENHPTLTSSNDSSFYRHPRPERMLHSVSHNSKEIATHSWKAQTTSPEFLQMKGVDPKSSHSYYDWRTPLLSQTGIPSISQNQSWELQNANPLPSNPLMNRTSKVPVSCISQNESVNMGSQIPVPSTTPPSVCDHILFSPTQVPSCIPCNVCDHMLLSSTQFKSNQSMGAHGSTSSFLFPFSSQDCREFVQPTWSQSSSQCLPQWLINAKQQKETPLTLSQPYPATYHPSSVSGASVLAASSPYQRSMIPYPHDPKSSFRSLQSSSAGSGTSFSHPPLIPAPPGFRRFFPINSCSKKRMKVKDGRKSKNSSLHFDHAKGKKRPAVEANDSARSIKKPNWQMQDSNANLGLNGPADFSVNTQCNSDQPEPNAYRDKESYIGYSQMEIQKDGLRTSSGANFSKLGTVARSGPIKLSAGAKHILKPNQNVAQDHSQPTYSTTPFGAVTNASKGPVFQKKSAQIYRF